MRALIAPAALLAVFSALLPAPSKDGLRRERQASRVERTPPSGILERLAPFLDPADYRALRPAHRRELIHYASECLDGNEPLARCWAPGTPMAVIRCFHAIEEVARGQDPGGGGDPPEEANQLGSRWSWTATDGSNQGSQGLPVTLTWGLAPDGTPINGSAGIGDATAPSDLIARLAVIYASQGANTTDPPDQQPWFPIIADVFANISAQSGVSYVYEPNDDGIVFASGNRGILGVRPDVRIGGHDIDGDSSTLAYNYFPSYGEMILDTNDNWLANTAGNSRRLRNLVEHEHGHGLGLRHVCPTDGTKLMEPLVNTNFLGIQFDDLYGIQRHYGDHFEKVGSSRENDRFADATPITLVAGTTFSESWLSIDGKEDTDYVSFTAVPESSITVRVIPSPNAYQEGGEASSGSSCPNASYPVFNSKAIHDLEIRLFDPAETLLATAASAAIGQTEEIYAAGTAASGTHYVEIRGSSENEAQLYRLEVLVDAPSVAIDLTASTLIAESFGGQNGQPDPGETVRFDLTLSSIGALDATKVHAVLTGPPGFTSFTGPQDYGDLPTGTSATRPFTFALDGSCGDTLVLGLTISADDGYNRTIPASFPVGTDTVFLAETVESLGLPAGWSTIISGTASPWQASFEEANTPPYAFYGRNVASIGEASLVTPPITLGAGGNSLSFRHYHELPFTFDGGVLEIAINGGAWLDIIAAGGSFVEGGYQATIRTGFGNPLAGRPGWSGVSNGFTLTTVDLPPAAASQEVRIRWRLGNDVSRSDIGWFVDDITIGSILCDTSGPVLTLSATDATASEFSALDIGELLISTSLPVLDPVPITLTNTGTAEIGSDVAAFGSLVLASGESALLVPVTATSDSLVEGDEMLQLTMDQGAGTAAITIADTPYGQWAAARFGLGTAANGALEDFDADGALNIEEYAWLTNPADPENFPPRPTATLADGFLEVGAPAAVPADLLMRGESSADLVDWSDSGVLALPGAFRIPRQDPERFLRLTYELLPSSP